MIENRNLVLFKRAISIVLNFKILNGCFSRLGKLSSVLYLLRLVMCNIKCFRFDPAYYDEYLTLFNINPLSAE